jgi:hypothetical protein
LALAEADGRWYLHLGHRDLRGGGVNKSYVSRILRLTLLAPDIVETVMDGCPAPRPAELMQPFPVSCERQRAQFC